MSTTYITHIPSPLGELTLASDGQHLTGLWMAGQAHHAPGLSHATPAELPVFQETRAWLARYFAGEETGKLPPMQLSGTPFQQAVWQALLGIKKGHTVTYGQLAEQLSRQLQRTTSARAVGGAVARNPISVLVPCHRVVGAQGQLTGYAGGEGRKAQLLKLEGVTPPPKKKGGEEKLEE